MVECCYKDFFAYEQWEIGGVIMKFVKIIMSVVICSLFICGCTSNDEKDKDKVDEKITINGYTVTEKSNEFPEDFAQKYIFSSGVGGWWTQIGVNKDGTFSGNYQDSEMGNSGDGYDYTLYQCDFQGKFEMVGKLDEYSYLVKLSELSTTEEENDEWIEDGVRYVVSMPYGFEDSEYFVLYTPEMPVDGVNEDFLFWWPLRFSENPPETLQCYGIHNIETGAGFISEEVHFVLYDDNI